jgi:serine phosphatase RsbU (regulator of sigma subunit)/anti-sigma regulatory factor (Ser/Thr protein kinase)
VWLAVTTSRVPLEPDGEPVFVGIVRDVTSERVAAAREQAAARLATALVAGTTVGEVFAAGLAAGAADLRLASAVAVLWPEDGSAPVLYPHRMAARDWHDLPDDLRHILDRARTLRESTVAASPDGRAAPGLAAALGPGVDGALWLRYRAPRPIDATDEAVAVALVTQLNLALQRARRYEQARTTSLTLQRAMLGATALPPRFAVRYEPAVPPLEIGGDWYDVIPLGDNSFGVIVGDCVGRGLAAAAVMGQLRSSARALLCTGVGPARMLDQLDVVAATIPGASCTTVFAAVLDAARGELCYTSAGHVPGLLVCPSATGDVVRRFDDRARSLPLATFDCAPRPEATLALPPGATLVLFTDGLVERRAVPIDVGIDEVAAALIAAGPRTPDEVAEAVLRARRPELGYDDDVAMVVYRRPPAPLRLDQPAEARGLVGIRRRLHDWLTAAGVARGPADDLVMAVNEACTNSIEHGYRDRSRGRVRVEAVVEPTRIALTVADTGRWLTNSGTAATGVDRGRGIEMMRALCDDVVIERTDAGTIVRMTRHC